VDSAYSSDTQVLTGSSSSACRGGWNGESAQLWRWAEQLAGKRVWAVEGTGSYGAGLARHLQAADETVREVCPVPIGGRVETGASPIRSTPKRPPGRRSPSRLSAPEGRRRTTWTQPRRSQWLRPLITKPSIPGMAESINDR
jgi:hypothetical protein